MAAPNLIRNMQIMVRWCDAMTLLNAIQANVECVLCRKYEIIKV